MQNLYDGTTNWQIKLHTKTHFNTYMTVSDYVYSHAVRTLIYSWFFWFTNNSTIESITCKSKISLVSTAATTFASHIKAVWAKP